MNDEKFCPLCGMTCKGKECGMWYSGECCIVSITNRLQNIADELFYIRKDAE